MYLRILQMSTAAIHSQDSRSLSKQIERFRRLGLGSKHKSLAAALSAQARKSNFLARNKIAILEQKSRLGIFDEWKQHSELMLHHYQRLHSIVPHKRDFNIREMRILRLAEINFSLIKKDMPIHGTSCEVCFGSGFVLGAEVREKCPFCPRERVEYPMESDEFIESLPEDRVCKICAGREGKYLLMPCGHGLLCDLCVATQDADDHDPACPFCRQRPVAPLQLRML